MTLNKFEGCGFGSLLLMLLLKRLRAGLGLLENKEFCEISCVSGFCAGGLEKVGGMAGLVSAD